MGKEGRWGLDVGESELALPLRRLLAQHQDVGLRGCWAERWSPCLLKEEEKGARVSSSFRDLRSPQAGRLFPSLPCLALVCKAGFSVPGRHHLSSSSAVSRWKGSVGLPVAPPLPVGKGGGVAPAAPVLMSRRVINTAGVSSGDGGPGVHLAVSAPHWNC